MPPYLITDYTRNPNIPHFNRGLVRGVWVYGWFRLGLGSCVITHT